ncbi:MAG: class I SAM-dependent methyltransferase [Brachymonas sp.]|nr:class I SAM-dependent methyltransferase [Brachymonas sp.]
MNIKKLDAIWNESFDEEIENLYDDPEEAGKYNDSNLIRQDGIIRAKNFNFPEHYTVLDIGSGPGVLSLPLSRIVKKVVAIEPSLEMVKHFKLHIEKENIKNIEIINEKWEEAACLPQFDAVIASYSLSMKNISEVISKMNSSSKNHCYIFWFSGMTSWEKEQKAIYEILGKEYRIKLNKSDIICQVLRQFNISPEVKILNDTHFDRSHKTIGKVLDFIKSRYKIKTNAFDDSIKSYINQTYLKSEQGYVYKDDTKYTKIHWRL